MNDYEVILSNIFQEVPVVEGSLREDGYEGLYRDGRIYLEKNLNTLAKKEILVEEYFHHKTSVGDIINYKDFESRKQEATARRMALEALVPLNKLIECAFSGSIGKYECAEFLEVSPVTLEAAIKHYSSKYGQVHLHNGCILRFNEYSVTVLNTGLQ
ncbi:toxin [Enterococcus sp. 2201sp1_2201st1_B8_2201SCRN_220225]|uniref:toxin n=1 Tax=unclassified Enterococcus TaxID=2608891 RepID=UPI0034A2AA25